MTQRCQSFQRGVSYLTLFVFALAAYHFKAICAISCTCEIGCLEPMSPFAFVGEEISLCCRNSGESVQVKDVTFDCGSTNSSYYSGNYHGMQENETCVNVTVFSIRQQGFCECRYKSNRCSSLLKVDEVPKADDDFKCIFYNNEHITCSWSSQTFRNPTHVKVNLKSPYGNECDSLPVDKRSCMLRPPCEIDIDRNCTHLNVSLEIIYENKLRTPVVSHSPWKIFYLPSITKLAPLSAEIRNTTPTCIYLTLNLTAIRWDLDGNADGIIQLSYMSSWTPHILKSSNITVPQGTKKIETELCNLTPYSSYMLSASIRTNSSQVWSESYNFTGRTLKDVPARSPPIVRGAFTRLNNVAKVFWKLLSPIQWHSDVKEGNYHISIWNNPLFKWEFIKSVSALTYQTELPLVKDGPTLVKIQANNSVGFAEDCSKLTIPSKAEAPSAPTNVTAIIRNTGSNVTISWDSPLNAGEVGFFWCPWVRNYTCMQNTNSSKGPQIEWKLLEDIHTRSYTFDMPNLDRNLNYMFGVSVSRSNISSGIQWTNCVNTTTEGQKIFRSRSNCSISEELILKGDDEEWILNILTPILICVVLAVPSCICILKIITKYKREFEVLKPSVYRTMSGYILSLSDSVDSSPDDVRHIQESTNCDTSLTDETDCYRRMGFSLPRQGHTGKDDADSCMSGSDDNTSIHSYTGIDDGSKDNSHYGSGNSNTDIDEDSNNDSHYRSGNSNAEIDENNKDDSHDRSENLNAEIDEDSRNDSHYASGNSDTEEEEDSGQGSYGSKNINVEEVKESGDVSLGDDDDSRYHFSFLK